ncbi:MAG: Alkaline phosphatase synthesis transcriptional regulatory protein PhoP [Chloroflexi bacterium]|nr:Alkaline phosphatase synthesis transcriptional regulatory protein PhoP [Chloroflexota bacterium]
MNIPQGPILIVEDVANVLDLIEVTLTFKGYPVVTAKNGEEALEKVAQERPALIITDILMPYMDGFTLVQQLRTNPKTDDIPIIFLSATYLTPEDKEFALKLGAVRFLEKPIDTEEFLLTVAEILSQGIDAPPPPLEEDEFRRGYMARLEYKLQHKKSQIARVENLLKTLPDEQKPAFEKLYEESCQQKDMIQAELTELYEALEG